MAVTESAPESRSQKQPIDFVRAAKDAGEDTRAGRETLAGLGQQEEVQAQAEGETKVKVVAKDKAQNKASSTYESHAPNLRRPSWP